MEHTRFQYLDIDRAPINNDKIRKDFIDPLPSTYNNRIMGNAVQKCGPHKVIKSIMDEQKTARNPFGEFTVVHLKQHLEIAENGHDLVRIASDRSDRFESHRLTLDSIGLDWNSEYCNYEFHFHSISIMCIN